MYVDYMYLYIRIWSISRVYLRTRRSVSVLPKNLDSGQGLINKIVMGIRTEYIQQNLCEKPPFFFLLVLNCFSFHLSFSLLT